MTELTDKKKRFILTDFLRAHFGGFLDPVGRFFNRLGVHPNTMTILGLVGNAIGAVLLSQGQMFWGGILIFLMGPVDALDGTMARLRGEPTKFGGFVDSVTDRYSELVILGGLMAYFIQHSAWLAVGLTYAAAAGSVLVSYVRARGQSVGYDTKVGILTRFERYVVLAPALLLNYPIVAVAIIALFANLTALQRILDVRRQAYQQEVGRR